MSSLHGASDSRDKPGAAGPRSPHIPIAKPAAPPIAGIVPAPPQVILPEPPPVASLEEPPAEATSSRLLWGIGAAVFVVAVSAGVWWATSGRAPWSNKDGSSATTSAIAAPDQNPPPQPVEVAAPVVLMQEGDGSLNFLAETAVLHGPHIRLELREGEGLIVDWLTAEDWLSWEFQVLRPGFFRVEATYAADEAMAGNAYTMTVDDQEQTRTVKDTGGPTIFGQDTFYLVLPRSGRHTLRVRPANVSEHGLMVLKSIRLTPR